MVRSDNMFFTQGPLSLGKSFGHERRLLWRHSSPMETAAHPRTLFMPRSNGMIFVTLSSSASLRTGVVKTFRCQCLMPLQTKDSRSLVHWFLKVASITLRTLASFSHFGVRGAIAIGTGSVAAHLMTSTLKISRLTSRLPTLNRSTLDHH